MSIPGISIRNPVMVTMICVLIIAAGIIGFLLSPLQDQPNINYPAITITTLLPGGNASIVNQTVTKPIEKAMNTLSGINNIQSYSESGKSSITIDFELGTDMHAAYNQIENKLNHVRNELPQDTRPPLIATASNQNDPVIMYALHGPQSLQELDQFARREIEPRLQNIEGVGQIMITGASEQAVSINLNLGKMAALQISPMTVQQAFKQEHVQLPGGTINTGQKQFTLNLDLEYQKVHELNKLIVAYRKGAPVYLGDIADVKFGFSNDNSEAYFNKYPSIGINVIRQTKANTVGVIDAVQKRINSEVIPQMPTGMKMDVVYNQATFILKIIHSLEQNVWLAVLTAGLVIFLFLRSIRPTLIVMAVVPISLLGAVAVVYFSGYTLNAITLLSLTVLVGIVVDDSIVVLENIFRIDQQAKGLTPEQAAIIGGDQVTSSVTACSISLVSIFLPIVFMGGVLGLLFKPFAVVVTAGILCSLLLSLTFNPVLCSRFLAKGHKDTKFALYLLKCFNAIREAYIPILNFILRHRWVATLIVVIMIGLCPFVFKLVNKTFMPANENTGYFTVQVQAPEGMSATYTRARVNAANKIITASPDVLHTFSSTGPTANQGSISVKLKPINELKEPQKQFMQDLRKKFQDLPGALYFVQLPNNANQITYQIRGEDFNKVVDLSYQLLNEVMKHPELGESYIYLASDQPQFQVFVDRVLGNSLGITSYDVANTLMAMSTDGVRIGKFDMGSSGERYKVLLKTKKNEFTSPDDLSRIYIKPRNGQPVRLNTVVDIEESLLPSKITRTNLNYSVGFSSEPSISTNNAITLVEKLAKPILPKGYVLHLTGNTASLGSTEKSVMVTLLLILGLIYIVLASQFNSFLQPIIVMMMQPLAMIGGLFILYITNETLNVYSMIGMLLLVGLITKNTILMVSLANQRVRAGEDVLKALQAVAPDRLRPVLMTSLALIFAMIPSIFATGDTYRSLSMVILGGIAISSLLSMIIIPAFYSMFAQIAPPKPKIDIPKFDEEKLIQST